MGRVEMKRNYRMDNIRFFLMFCVVFGHLLESYIDSGAAMLIYKIIYSFHMPAFFFLNGYFVRQDRKQFIRQLIVLYFIFQTTYLIFQYVITNDGSKFVLQYTTPYWLLWYLFPLIFYYLLLPLVETDNIKSMGIVLAAVLVLSVLAGFDSTVGYYMSLSRFFVFFPFFVLGLYSFKWTNRLKVSIKLSHQLFWAALCTSGVLMGALYIRMAEVPTGALYGSYSYAGSGTTPFTRLILFVIALCWIGLLLNVMPAVKIPVLTSIGQNTMPIFLLHGFMIKGLIVGYLGKYAVFQYTGAGTIVMMAGIACVILLLFGNTAVSKVFKGIFLQ